MKEVRKQGRFPEWKFLSIFITDAAMNVGRRAATLCLKGLFLELTSLACDWAVARRKAQCIVLFLVAMRRKPLWIFEKAMCNSFCATLHVNRFYNCLGLNPRSNKQTNKQINVWLQWREEKHNAILSCNAAKAYLSSQKFLHITFLTFQKGFGLMSTKNSTMHWVSFSHRCSVTCQTNQF